jgi:murein DD-endopeptidase MepM/ murein hydrolase activator NlpD
LPPHLHFEVRRGKTDINPISIMKQGPANGDLQR